VLIFSGLLSALPIYLEDKNVQSTYKLKFVREGYDSYGRVIKSYPKMITKQVDWGAEPGDGYKILLKEKLFNPQEAYLFLNYNHNFELSFYFGDEFPQGEIDEVRNEDFESVTLYVNQGELTSIKLTTVNPDCKSSWELDYEEKMERLAIVLSYNAICN